MRPSLLAIAVALGVALSGCTLVKNKEDDGGSQSGVDVFFEDENFDPDQMAADMWDDQVVPYLTGKAGDLVEIKQLIANDPDEAGQAFGYREKAEGSPWIMITKAEGTIVGAKTDTRAATVDIDVDGDGAADAQAQIGPVVRGTALRDSLDFVSFGDFTNQIDYAKFGKSLNGLVNERQLAGLPREDLIGRSVTLLGVFPLADPDALPVITAAEIEVGEPQ